MVTLSNISLQFNGKYLFEDVNVKFTDGNCYGVIGANGAGKSTLLKIISSELDSDTGTVILGESKRVSVLRQDQFGYDNYSVIDTVLMGYKQLYDVYKERNAIYANPNMSDEDGMRVGELESIYGEMDGYKLETDAEVLLGELGIALSDLSKNMRELETPQKIKVLLAQALFGNPDVLLLDEPTNQLDYQAVVWLENFLESFENTVIVVSHNRHFLNNVCTHIVDVDFAKVNVYPGNYDFWQKAIQLALKQKQDQNKKAEKRILELQEFVNRFSANASKSKQATARKKMIEDLKPEDLPVSSRRTPFIRFKAAKSSGGSIVEVNGVSHNIDGEAVLKDVHFRLEKGDKVAIIGENDISKTTLLQILAGEIKPDTGTVQWGERMKVSYFPKNNTAYFTNEESIFTWLQKYTDSTDSQYIRGFLGRMLFSGDDINKKVKVLSGGEKARVMFSKVMLEEGNALLFDEPTDHLDLEAIQALNDALIAFEDCLFFTSHDFELLNTVANRIIEVSPLGIINQPGTFDEYMNSSIIEKKRKKLYQ